MSLVNTPDGLIDLDLLENATEEEMWILWPNTAFWIWENRQKVNNKVKRKTKKPWNIGDDYDNMYMCAYGGYWD